jgi:hypothetical protein
MMTGAPQRRQRPRSRRLTLALAASLAASLHGAWGVAAGQPRGESPRPAAPACERERALLLVRQQADEAKSFEPSAEQIRVLTRAADLLWPHQREAARAIFTEAFDLAVAHFRRRGDEQRSEGRLSVLLPDQRFEVMSAIAKHDPAWSRRLAERTAEESKRDAEQTASQSASAATTTRAVGEKMINLALSLLKIDQAAALGLARSSFRQPASIFHPHLFYELAKLDQAAADGLYLEAVAAYAASGTTHDLAYLSAYPFALGRTISPVRFSTNYVVPAGFRPSAAAREAFVRALIARADVVLKTPDQFAEGRAENFWETTQVAAALISLAPLVEQQLPALSERVAEMRARAEAAVGDRARQSAEGFVRFQQESDRPRDFEAEVERAEREANPEKRDQLIAFLVHSAKTGEELGRIERLAEKVSDPQVRRQLLDWINFSLAQRLTKDGLFDEAKRAAERVGELDLRSALYFEIGRESIKRLSDKARARELLDEVAAAAAKAPDTIVKARTQLGVAHLFAEIDPVRALEVVSDAVKTVNALERPDFSQAFVSRRIEGKGFGTYTGFNVPGFNLENAFTEVGAHDFEGALLAARNVAARPLRAAAVLGLSARCLEQPAPPRPAAGRDASKSAKP